VTLLLISPRHAHLPFARWLPELAGRMVAVAPASARLGDCFREVRTVPDHTDDAAVLAAARDLVARHRPTTLVALAESDIERAAALRAEFGMPGFDPRAAAAYRDKVLMKEYARAAGISVPRFAPVHRLSDVTDFLAAYGGPVVVKPRGASGATGVHVVETAAQATALSEESLLSTPYEVEEFVAGQLYHVDAFRVAGRPVAAVASRYTTPGCLSHWSDSPHGSRTLPADDPLRPRLVAETWRLIEALPSPPTVCVHAEFFVTAEGEVVLCEVAGRVAGGTIPVMLRHVLGIDPRELWARVECGLPNDLEAVRANADAAPSAACCGLPPQRGRIRRTPQVVEGALDFTVHGTVGDDWGGERYARRKSGDFVASWVVTAEDDERLTAALESTVTLATAGFAWELEAVTGAAR
jgi:biotin carboxylase